MCSCTSAAAGNRLVVHANPALLQLAASRSVLLLQGPLGPFFDRLIGWLLARGAQVNRVAFQAGDEADCQALTPHCFVGPPQEWPAYFQSLLANAKVDCVVLFGQARTYHAQAIQCARELGIAVVVLEEGYFRPGYITMELDGVNGYSTTLQRFLWDPAAPGPAVKLSKPVSTEGQFGQMAKYAMRHYWNMQLGAGRYPNYVHHKQSSVWFYCQFWVNSWFTKHLHLRQDDAKVRALADQNYFFVPLQHDGDAQITHHSAYGENTEFIIEVLRSFADHAPSNALLVFRQHPFSRGGPGHSALIFSLAAELGVRHRVVHLVEGHTPTLVKQSLGVVLINSTVGLQALSNGKPLKALGHAMYDQPQVTYQGPLADFWQHFTPPNPVATHNFLMQMRNLTQAPCNVYGLPDEPLLWDIHA